VGSTRRYLLRKTGQALATLVFVLAMNFFLFRIMPGDPVRLMARNTHLPPEQQQELIHELGLDLALPAQFVVYVKNTLTGNLGISIRTSIPVAETIKQRIWPTVLLVGISTLLSTILGIIIGIYGAWRRGSAFDKSTLFGSLILYSVPEGWLGMLLIILLVGTWHLFPAGGYAQQYPPLFGLAHVTDVLNHMFLPALTLTLGYIGEYEVIMRSSLLEVMGDDYLQTARAKGLQDKLIRRRHAVPNALLPTLTLVFYSFGFVLGGAVITEAVFSWPGLGLLEYQAIGDLDYPIMQGLFLLLAAGVILFNLAADIMYGYLDPRIKES
jgi:peptide/nickel transport system permease protein